MTTPATGDVLYPDPEHFAHVFEFLHKPAATNAGYEVVGPEFTNSEVIHGEIIRHLEEADLVLCDMSTDNSNVFFELGIRVALDRPVALVKDDKMGAVPFDTGSISSHRYNSEMTPWVLRQEVPRLEEFIRAAAGQDRNSLWRHFGITQRAHPAEAGENPLEEKIDYVIRELSTLRQVSVTAPPAPPTPPNRLTVDTSAITGSDSTLTLTLTGTTTVNDLLDSVWADLRGAVDPFTYTRAWILYDPPQDRYYYDIGTSFAQRVLGTDRDRRRLLDVGIGPGTRLAAVRVGDWSFRE